MVLDFEPCERCRDLARRFDQAETAEVLLGSEPVDIHPHRESARVLFGLHLQTAHPEVAVPEPDTGCRTCRDLVDDVQRGIEPEDCEATAAFVLEQHLLGHLVTLVPR